MARQGRNPKAIILLLLAGVCLLAVSGYLYFTGEEKIDWTLNLVGREGSRQLSLEEIKKMPAWEGRGGFFTTVGLVNGPFTCKGVPVEDLCALVGGIGPDECLWVWAPDGYSMVFSYEQVKGDFVTYDSRTLREIPTQGVKMILMYEQDGAPLKEDDGRPLRIALVGSDDFLTEGHYWVKWVDRMEVRPLTEGETQ